MLQNGHSMIYSIAAVFIATLGPNDFERIGQSQNSLDATHSLMLLFIGVSNMERIHWQL